MRLLSLTFVGATSACMPGAVAERSQLATTTAPKASPDRERDARLADFDAMWRFVAERYPFFADKQTDWSAVARDRGERIALATNDEEFLHELEATLDELYDPHCMLTTNSDASWRPVPFDVWPVWSGERAFIEVVRTGSPAAAAGLRAGDEIVMIGDLSVRDAAVARMPRQLRERDPAAADWALLSAATGRHGSARKFTIRRADRTQEIVVPLGSLENAPLVEARLLDGRTGYVRISSFADAAVIEAFDAALEQVRTADALVLDVRANTGGDTAYARPIMGRFIAARAAYATMRRRDGEGLGAPWTEYVEPRGPWRFEAPVVVIVDRFSVSMAEGFAMGMHGLGRARIVGTKMAGLGAAIGRVELPYLGAAAQCSTEPVYHVDGTPRWTLRPDIEVDLAAAAGERATDPILAAALADLQRSRTDRSKLGKPRRRRS